MKPKIRLLFLCIFFLTISLSSFAQVRMGIKGGYDVIDNHIGSGLLKTSNYSGYQIGPTLEIVAPLTGFGVELSILYGHKEFKITEANTELAPVNYDYISIPLSVKKRFGILGPVNLFIAGGAFVDVKLQNKKVEEAISNYKSKEFGAGLTASAGVQFFKRIDVGMQYRNLLSDNFSSQNADLQRLFKKDFATWSVYLTFFL